MYKPQSAYIYRAPQCMSPRRNWAAKGVGEFQYRRLEKRLSTLPILCGINTLVSTYRWRKKGSVGCLLYIYFYGLAKAVSSHNGLFCKTISGAWDCLQSVLFNLQDFGFVIDVRLQFLPNSNTLSLYLHYATLNQREYFASFEQMLTCITDPLHTVKIII